MKKWKSLEELKHKIEESQIKKGIPPWRSLGEVFEETNKRRIKEMKQIKKGVVIDGTTGINYIQGIDPIPEDNKGFGSLGPMKQIKNIETGGRQFESGAYRDTDEGKLDFEAFLSPQVLKSYSEYMHKNRKQSNGVVRDGDNWQKGLDKDVYMKSMFRHFFAVWEEHRGIPTTDGMKDNLNALLFNVMGYLFEQLKLDGLPRK